MSKLRIQLRGQAFLIYNETLDDLPDADWVRVAFVRRLRDAQRQFSFELYGFALSTSGFELVVAARKDNGLSDVLQLLQSSFARDVNRALGRHGALFRHRYQDKVLVGDHVLEETISRVISEDAILSSDAITHGGQLRDVHPVLDTEPTISLPPRFATDHPDLVADASARWCARVDEMSVAPAPLLSSTSCIAASWVDVFKFAAWRVSVARAYRGPARRYCEGIMTPFPRGTHPPSRAPEPGRDENRASPPLPARSTRRTSRKHTTTGRVPRRQLQELRRPRLRLIHGSVP